MQQLITARRVLIGPAGQHIDDGAVLIDDDTIIAVGTRTHLERKAPAGVRRRDFGHHTMLPGLINCHVHLALDASPDPVTALTAADDTDLYPAMAARAQQALHAGVTTVRDLGDRGGLAIRLREAIARGDVPGPRILSSGPPLTTRQGHCWFFGGEVDSDEAAIRRQVQTTAADGADLIKIMASGGQLTRSSAPMWQSQFSTDQLRAAVAEASAAGLGVAAHAHGTDAIASAVQAGVTTVEHCTWLAAGGGGYDPRDDIAREMANRGIYACVALPPHWRAFMERMGPTRAEHLVQLVQWLDKLGVRLIPGTDAGLRGSVFSDFVSALQFYEHAGFARDHIIEMATVTSARALGRGHEFGQLAPGYSADLLVVDGDPLTTLEALRNQELVLTRGRAATPAAAHPDGQHG